MPAPLQGIDRIDRLRHPPICEEIGPDVTQYLPPLLEKIQAMRDRSIYWRARQQFGVIYAELARLVNLKDGWDSYDAVPPSQAAIETAERILAHLRLEMLLPNRVVPSAEGGVGICFIDADRYADIEVFNDQEILGTTYRGKSEPHVWEVTASEESIGEAIKQIRAHLNT